MRIKSPELNLATATDKHKPFCPKHQFFSQNFSVFDQKETTDVDLTSCRAFKGRLKLTENYFTVKIQPH